MPQSHFLILVYKLFAKLLLVFIISAFSFGAYANDLLDEFSAIYHSNVIVEVAVSLDEYGHPDKSYYLKRIKGSSNSVADALDFFGISKKKKKIKPDQKRLMFFYKNGYGRWRSMNLIRQGVGPYSGDETYRPYLKMVKLITRSLAKSDDQAGIIEIANSKVCKALVKNSYFRNRYHKEIEGDKFALGANSGLFKEFLPLVRIRCD